MTQAKFLSIRDICSIAIFTALIAALSPLSIPTPVGVSITLSSFVVPFAAVVLGAKRGTIAAIAYILLGAMGLPIFSNFAGGASMLIGPTGGFLFGFPLYAFLAGWGADRDRWFWLAGSLSLGVTLFFAMGMLQFSFVTGNTLAASFTMVVLTFVPTEIIKLVLVWVLGRHVRARLTQSGLLAIHSPTRR